MSLPQRRTVLRLIAAPLVALALISAASTSASADRYDDRRSDRYEDRRGGYNDEYIFVATKTAADLDVHPVAKVPLFPLTLILDLVALPFEIIAGFF